MSVSSGGAPCRPCDPYPPDPPSSILEIIRLAGEEGRWGPSRVDSVRPGTDIEGRVSRIFPGYRRPRALCPEPRARVRAPNRACQLPLLNIHTGRYLPVSARANITRSFSFLLRGRDLVR